MNNTAGQADELIQFNFKKVVYASNEIMKAAVVSGLNVAILALYRQVKKGGGVGTGMYCPIDDPVISSGSYTDCMTD